MKKMWFVYIKGRENDQSILIQSDNKVTCASL